MFYRISGTGIRRTDSIPSAETLIDRHLRIQFIYMSVVTKLSLAKLKHCMGPPILLFVKKVPKYGVRKQKQPTNCIQTLVPSTQTLQPYELLNVLIYIHLKNTNTSI